MFNCRTKRSMLPGLIIAAVTPCFLSTFAASPVASADPIIIHVNGADSGRTFDGIGGLSAGASSRLLIDYPLKQRSEVLDYLFKPDFGAALQINKVEIGSDANSTDGSEPSPERELGDSDFHRGYEWWLMAESKKRNPNEKLYLLEWGLPGWLNPGNQSAWSPLNYGYILDFLDHMKSDYGLTPDYVGGWNERGYDKNWYEGFRQALNSGGFSTVKVVGDDSSGWKVAGDLVTDPAFASSIDIIGQHYADYSPKVLADPNFQAALKSGKSIWFSEMGSQDSSSGAANLIKSFIESYIDDRATANINWSTVWSVVPGLPDAGDGLMVANEPWTGHYVVGKSIWACAHVTQFAQPGWQFLDSGCGFIGGDESNGSYVSLKSPDGADYSVIAETLDAKSPRSVTFDISGGLSTATVHLWATNLLSNNQADWFVKQPKLLTSNGSFTVTFQPGFIYSLSTTSGQSKGVTTPPPSAVLPMPYKEDFSKYAVGTTPKYFSDQMGTFEVASAPDGRRGKCLRQMVVTQPILWSAPGDPSTLVGDSRWTDYVVSSDVLLEQPGYVDLIGRMQSCPNNNSSVLNGYHLRVTDTGAWSIRDGGAPTANTLASGTATFSVNTWHKLALEFSGANLSASIDGVVIAHDLPATAYSHGLAGYQVSSWQNADFQNFVVTAAPPDGPH